MCAQGVRESGRAFPTPTCCYRALQFAPLILCRFLVGCRVKTNSLHSVLKLKSIHLSKQAFLSSLGARPIPEWDSVHLSLAKKVLSEINQSRTIILLHFFFSCYSKWIWLVSLWAGTEGLLVLHQWKFYPVFTVFKTFQSLWFSKTHFQAQNSCLRHLRFRRLQSTFILLLRLCPFSRNLADFSAWKQDDPGEMSFLQKQLHITDKIWTLNIVSTYMLDVKTEACWLFSTPGPLFSR